MYDSDGFAMLQLSVAVVTSVLKSTRDVSEVLDSLVEAVCDIVEAVAPLIK